MNDNLVNLIINALKELGEQQELELPADPNAETPLFGENGVLDSMGLVTLVVGVEQAIEDDFGASVTLADAKAMSQKNSPYRTIGSLAEYAGKLIAEEKGNG